MTDTKPVYVTIADAARRSGVSPTTMRRAIRDTGLPTVTVSSRTLIAIAELDRRLGAQVVQARTGERP